MNGYRTLGFAARLTLAALASIAICFMFSGSTWAQLTNHATVVNFSGPVEVPGSTTQVLPAGEYLFKVVQSQGDRNIVQISNADDTHVFTTILAVPIHRDEESDKTIITFDERPAGQVPALKAWFYPNEKDGQEFVYPKNQATDLAKSSNTAVPYSDSKLESTVAGSSTNVDVSSAAPEPIRAISATGATVQPEYSQQSLVLAAPPASPVPPVPVARAQSTASPSDAAQKSAQTQTPVQTASLPRTGSEVPLLALLGACSLFAAISMKVISVLCGR